MGIVEDIIATATVELGLKFLLPAVVIIIVAYKMTGGRTYIPIALGILGGFISSIMLTTAGF